MPVLNVQWLAHLSRISPSPAKGLCTVMPWTTLVTRSRFAGIQKIIDLVFTASLLWAIWSALDLLGLFSGIGGAEE